MLLCFPVLAHSYLVTSWGWEVLSDGNTALVRGLVKNRSSLLGRWRVGVDAGTNATLGIALGSHCTPLLAQLTVKWLLRTVCWWKAAPGVPLSWICWALTLGIFASWRVWLVACSITRFFYLLSKEILSFVPYVSVQNKDLEGSFFGAIADPPQMKWSQVTSPIAILFSLLFLCRLWEEKNSSVILSVRNKQDETTTSNS